MSCIPPHKKLASTAAEGQLSGSASIPPTILVFGRFLCKPHSNFFLNLTFVHKKTKKPTITVFSPITSISVRAHTVGPAIVIVGHFKIRLTQIDLSTDKTFVRNVHNLYFYKKFKIFLVVKVRMVKIVNLNDSAGKIAKIQLMQVENNSNIIPFNHY
ncbi:hypothetical protein BpHYR1_054601 [Brachionus plicatilis]|uniref:Uncharacterized protein n=1 Tax=Brachionus plicatilis TaxID=10195 RepID=A0A3M7RFI2_BRAPC|nr:hypothetical protein BpHYR1_054601 [Brachionus plicatilis]